MMKPVLYDGKDGEIELPWRWEICSRCQGGGTDKGSNVECDGGGFTASQWADQDDDFKQGYLRGDYDKPCATCTGSGKVQRVDFQRLTKAQKKAWNEQVRDEREIRAIERMERMTGA